MTEIERQLPWEEKNWIEEVTHWANVRLAEHGIKLTGIPLQVHVAAWSTVYSLPTNQGLYYFKALCPALKHEPLLTQQLWCWQPDLIQSVLEIEPSQGWMLMPNGGLTLRQVLEQAPSLNYWKKILPQYARFQINMISHNQELLAIGVKDRRLKELPLLATILINDPPSICVGQTDGLSVEEYQSLKRVMPKLQRLCEQLAQYGIPETLQHDDFHDGNIFVVEDHFRFFDWAESFIAHPFFTLVVTLRSIAYRFNLDENSSELHELEELYLMEWREFGDLSKLREASKIAQVIGRINRALTWQMVVSSLPEPYREKEADAVPGWVKLFLEKITLSV